MEHHCDILVAGGGSAGLAAALAAARSGAQTILIDRQARLGGMGVNALVHTFCGLFHPDISGGPVWLNPGIPSEIGAEIMHRTHQQTPDLMGGVFVLRQHPSIFATLADDLCRAEKCLTLMTGAEWSGLAPHGKNGHSSPLTNPNPGAGWTATFAIQGAKSTIHASALVDTTGDAAGARLWNPALCQATDTTRIYRPAYICAFQQVIPEEGDDWRLRLGALIVRAVRDGALPAACLGTAFRNSPFPGEVFLTIDLEAGAAAWDPFDPVKRAQVEAEGRAAAFALWQLLRQRAPAFATCPPPILPTHAGIRESARYLGEYVLTAADLISSRRFEDEAALAGWPLEMRETARGPKFRHFSRPEPAGIPASCLRTLAAPGLFFAGRCISADHEALASVRVMGTCMATGQAAGKLAVDFAATHAH